MARRKRKRIEWQPGEGPGFTLEDEEYLPRHRRAVRRLARSAEPVESGAMAAGAWSMPSPAVTRPAPRVERPAGPATIPLGRRVGPLARQFAARTRADRAIPVRKAPTAKVSPEARAVNELVEEARGDPERLKQLWDYFGREYPAGLPESTGWHELMMRQKAGWRESDLDRELRAKGAIGEQKNQLAADLKNLTQEQANKRSARRLARIEPDKLPIEDPDAIKRIMALRRAGLDPAGGATATDVEKLILDIMDTYTTGKVPEREKMEAEEAEVRRKEARTGEIEALKVEEAPLLEEDKRLEKRVQYLRDKEFGATSPAARDQANAELDRLLGMDRAAGKDTVLGGIKERLAEVRRRRADVLRGKEAEEYPIFTSRPKPRQNPRTSSLGRSGSRRLTSSPSPSGSLQQRLLSQQPQRPVPSRHPRLSTVPTFTWHAGRSWLAKLWTFSRA